MQKPPGCMVRGFTLVELLVVISVIALLASMLMPAVQTVRISAQRAHCQGNLRQISLGIQAYATEWNGVNPPTYRASDTATWGELLSEAMEGSLSGGSTAGLGVWRCPVNRVQRYRCDEGASSEVCTSYTANGWNTDAGVWDGRFFAARQNKISHPSELAAVMENIYYRIELQHNDGLACTPFSPGAGARGVRYAHKAATNVLYADGHAAPLKLIKPRGSWNAINNTPTRSGDFTNGRFWWALD